MNLFKLYKILEVKPIVKEKCHSFKEDLESNMLERNKNIKEGIKAF